MSLDLSAVGHKTDPYRFEYDWKTAVLYALGIGAGPTELPWVFEGHGLRVFPTFPVVSGYRVMTDLIDRAKAPLRSVVHAGQTIRMLGPIQPDGVLTTTGTLRAIYDLKRMSRLVFETVAEQNGAPVCSMDWDLLVRNVGGFGGPRPPKGESVSPPRDQTADFERAEATSRHQALLYRLSGDLNPLHADPALAEAVGFSQGPILHGLCTLGFVARAVVNEACQGDERRLKSISMQFKKPVWPGETIHTQGYALGDGRWALAATAADRPEQILGNAWAEILN